MSYASYKLHPLNQAIVLAAEAHSGAVDKGSAPYILHPLRVMLAVEGIDAQIAAVLHDVIEDHGATRESLLAAGFASHIVEAVEAITRRYGEEYTTYIQRVATNPLAKAVKIADLKDNMDLSRIPTPGPEDHARVLKYIDALQMLEEATTNV